MAEQMRDDLFYILKYYDVGCTKVQYRTGPGISNKSKVFSFNTHSFDYEKKLYKTTFTLIRVFQHLVIEDYEIFKDGI